MSCRSIFVNNVSHNNIPNFKTFVLNSGQELQHGEVVRNWKLLKFPYSSSSAIENQGFYHIYYEIYCVNPSGDFTRLPAFYARTNGSIIDTSYSISSFVNYKYNIGDIEYFLYKCNTSFYCYLNQGNLEIIANASGEGPQSLTIVDPNIIPDVIRYSGKLLMHKI